ncbi:hypothetical protein QBC42DRAFT_279843 [Cladorrhinum samala]|uniref:Transcription factor TFIIIC triple barrel domain-containing protein n=1 Tax=Cladorrhinum samala TaxID=585594 RepID=A0AAV9HAN5_9PEZI|nr:hypothetical protein QBC42DRAFT_279843 [Cladorrhinum samala]
MEDDEWEYEYSTTENETYYLTLDLSVRDFLERRTDDIIHNTRGGYRVWYNPDFNSAESNRNADLNDDKDGDDGERGARELDNLGLANPRQPSQPPIDPQLQAQKDVGLAQNDQSDAPTEEIQILELHSKEPIVSYRNHVFRGSWCQNIGTELIFTPHDEKAPIPALRNLPQNIDLIAASSCRINFTEANLIEKDNRTRGIIDLTAEDLPERYKRNGGIYVHVGGDKSGQRQPQAHFLEDLISLKRKRGEMDEVTIMSLETQQNKLMMEDEEEERRRRKLQQDQQRVSRWRDKRKEQLESGMDPDRRYVPQVGTNGRKRWPRTRARRAALVRRDTNVISREGHAQMAQQRRRDFGNGEADSSTPTPSRWNELHDRR